MIIAMPGKVIYMMNGSWNAFSGFYDKIGTDVTLGSTTGVTSASNVSVTGSSSMVYTSNTVLEDI